MKGVVFILMMIIGSSVFSQIPGYLGKKISVSVGASGMPNLNGIFTQRTSGIIDELPMNYKLFNPNFGLDLGLGYVIGRKVNVQLSFMRKSKNLYIPYAGIREDEYINNNDLTVYYVDGGFAKISSQKIAISFQHFIGGAIAPIGKYWEYGFVSNTTKLQNDVLKSGIADAQYNSFNGNYIYAVTNASLVSEQNKVTSSMIFLGMGRKTMFDNGIFLDVRLRGYLPLSFKYLRTKQDYSSSPLNLTIDNRTIPEGMHDLWYGTYTNYTDEYIPGESYLTDRLKKYQYLNELLEFSVGVGYMF